MAAEFALPSLRTYRNEVWLVMHRESDDPELETAAVRLYLDESGGNDPNTPHAVIGGMFITRHNFMPFENAWDQLLEDHEIVPPLHMKEFGRPNGRFAKMSDCCRRDLFIEAADIIKAHRVGTISVSLPNDEYSKYVMKDVRDKFSVYGMCFTLTAVGTNIIAEKNHATDRVPFILDSGNPYAEHVRKAHASIQIFQRAGMFQHIGSLTFANDIDFGILQAADVIAWAARRRATKIELGYAFAPIAALFEEPNRHIEASWKTEWLQKLGAYLAEQMAAENK